MALGRQGDRQSELLVTWAEMPRSPGHAFYDRLQAELLSAGFDGFVEGQGRITKAGNSEIRKLLVLGATSMVFRAAQWNSAAGAWLRGVLERRPVRLATVALANKMARIA